MSDDCSKSGSNPLHSRDRLIEEINKLDLVIGNIDKGNTELSARLAKLYNERGYLKYLQVEFTDAVKDFTSAIELDQTLATAYYNRGLIHYRLARFDDAIKDMEMTLQLDRSFESAALCLKQSQKDHEKRNQLQG